MAVKIRGTPSSSQLIELRAGEINLSLPKNKENIDVVISVLENLKKTLDIKKETKNA